MKVKTRSKLNWKIGRLFLKNKLDGIRTINLLSWLMVLIISVVIQIYIFYKPIDVSMKHKAKVLGALNFVLKKIN